VEDFLGREMAIQILEEALELYQTQIA
jgi:hypothetical protein